MIWCVEDDSSIRDVEVYTLRSTGFEARGFADGTAFWSAIGTAQELPELVVLDVMLPGVDGVELLRRLRAAPATRSIPVVMATARGAEYDKIQALDLGADYYLTKPSGSWSWCPASRPCCAGAPGPATCCTCPAWLWTRTPTPSPATGSGCP